MVLGKKTRGKQKIEMKKIVNEEDKLVTFSKRRSGINKKASELVTLCGAEVGVLVFSPAGRPFTYGNPSFESVATRFLKNNNDNNTGNITRPLMDAHRKQRIDRLNKLHNDLTEELEAELRKEEMLRHVLYDHRTEDWWWMKQVEELCKDEAFRVLAFYKELHDTLCRKVQEKLSTTAAAHLPPPGQPQTGAEGFPCRSGSVSERDGVGPSTYQFPSTHPYYNGGNS